MTNNLNVQKSALIENGIVAYVWRVPIHCMQDNCLSKQHISNNTGSITNYYASIHQQLIHNEKIAHQTSSIFECSPVSDDAFMHFDPK